MLAHQGLVGEHRFAGEQGTLEYICRAGCVQYDPVDVCGRSADIALNSRVAGYRRSMLESLLYQRRELVDYFDKNLAIFAVQDWPYFARERARYAQNTRGGAELACACATVLDEIARRGALCSADIDLPGKVDWFWSATRTARAALEQLYFEGRLAIHHKRGTVKYYDLIERCLPADMVTAPDPLPDDEAHRQWRVMRRVGAVGLLWNRASDAWLGIPGLKAGERESAFAALCARGELTELEVEGVRWPLYMRACDEAELERALAGELAPRAELLAPLDAMLWDRRLVEALFDFEYRWEIYTPADRRRYGYYTLPLLYGEELTGRIELARGRTGGALELKGAWYEPGREPGVEARVALEGCLERFARFNDCAGVVDVRAD
ncbi:MAG TPA: YcaQ family DNA glycosylase [Candidatus Fimadaptatus faecigallinarum]|uniref:YcaQ family DNA glycosylase n=1 Tax=Candidatus Fimadaptatus faecigallinarum TaxID=2840814 RepID=A0A9D1LT80_9FIRM|nr:YcaQ family DNA glycosylase [Candidatus Fimadaptatus faecigallinarum]